MRLLDLLVGVILWIGLFLIAMCVAFFVYVVFFIREGDDEMFLGGGRSTPLPSPPATVWLRDHLPDEVAYLCALGAYAYEPSETVPAEFRETMDGLDIYPVQEHEAHFVYFDDSYRHLATDNIRWGVNGFSVSYWKDLGAGGCSRAENLQLQISMRNERRQLGLIRVNP